ncbi:MAG TPA: hypothetical protein VD838_08630, partial [Anaeromyxobacteraceae bacterium]|nr:hypothetical protein [Anaeromyxobacteraceae bacterium]
MGNAAARQVATAERTTGADAVDALRRRLAGDGAREHAVLDFLAGDLRDARESLEAIHAWMGGVEAALADGDGADVLRLALGGGPMARVEALGTALASVRRRLAQVAARM